MLQAFIELYNKLRITKSTSYTDICSVKKMFSSKLKILSKSFLCCVSLDQTLTNTLSGQNFTQLKSGDDRVSGVHIQDKMKKKNIKKHAGSRR